MDLCNFAVTGGNFTGNYRFLKDFHSIGDIPTIFQEKFDQTLENKHPAGLEDIIVVRKGSKQKHIDELVDVLTKLENARYRLSENKSELFKTEIEWIGNKIDQNGIPPLQDKLLAMTKYKGNLSTLTDILQQLLKNDEY